MNQLVVFDLDGVLINSEEANYQAFAHGLEQLGYRPERAAVIGLVGLPALTMLERLGCPPDRCLDIFEGFVKPYYLENLPEQASAMDGAADVLTELKARGYRIGSCTSGDLVTQRQALTSLGLWDFIEQIQTPCQSRYGKPDPRYLAELVDRFGPSQVTHVEDSEVGLRMGRDFGARTVFARYGYGQLTVETPDHQIERLSDLLALL